MHLREHEGLWRLYMVKDAAIKFVNKGSKFKNRNGAIVEVISDVDKLDQVTYKIKAKGSTFPDAKTVKVDSLISMLNQNNYVPVKDAMPSKRVGTANSAEEAKILISKSLKNHGPELRYMSSREANGNVWFSDTMGDSVGYYDKKSKNVYVTGDYVKYAVNVRDSSVKVEKFSFSSYTPERERKFENRLKELESNKNIKVLSVSTVTDPVDKHFTNKEIRYIMKDALPRPPYYGPRGREVVREAENYLASKGYNNSTGKYDKVVQGVRSLLSQSYLEGRDFAKAVDQEVERLLKKYSLTKDSDYFMNSNGTKYEVLERSRSGKNALLKSPAGQYIVAWNMGNDSWGQGHYFGTDYNKAEKFFNKKYAKDADGMKEYGMKEYSYSIRIGGDLRRVKVKANNASEALDKVKKEAIKFKMDRVSTKFDNNKLSTRDLTRDSESWYDVYKIFTDIADKYFMKGPGWQKKIIDEAKKVYMPHRGDRAWDLAYSRFMGI